MNSIKYSLMIVLLGGSLGMFAMESGALVSGTAVEKTKQEGFSVDRDFPVEVQLRILYQVLAGYSVPDTLHKIAILRKVCKKWNSLIYDRKFLAAVFKSCSMKNNLELTSINECIGGYLAYLMSKNELNYKEREFLELVCSPEWTVEAAARCLLAGADVTAETLKEDPSLMTCALALHMSYCRCL